MKNIKKVLAVMTAVSAFAASSSAFAATFTATADGDNDALFTYTEATYSDAETPELTAGNTVTINKVPDGALSGEMTLLVLDHDANLTNVADGDILYIDQGTYTAASGETAATNPEFVGKALGLKVADLLKAVDTTKAGVYNYPVKVGYYTTVTQDDPDGFAIADGNIVITVTEDEEVVVGFEVVWGDVDMNGGASGTDAAAIISKLTGGKATFTNTAGVSMTIDTTYKNADGKEVVWGDVDMNGGASGTDAAAIISKLTGGKATFTNTAGVSMTIDTTYKLSPVSE